METSLRRHLFDDQRAERAPTGGFDVRAIQVRDVRALLREPFQTDRSRRPIVTRFVAFGIGTNPRTSQGMNIVSNSGVDGMSSGTSS